MDPLKPNITSPRHSPSVIGKWVKHTIWAILIAVELALSAATPVAVIGAGIAPWGVWAKISSGLIAPERLIRHIQSLPRDIADTERLIMLIDQPWSIAKVRELMDVGSTLLKWVYTRERDRINSLRGGIDNYQKMRDETLVAMVAVLSIYLLLLWSVRLIRLGDRDTYLDSMRKNIARILGSNRHIESMTDSEIADELERLIWEQELRRS
jgi:hypothetical protein